EAVRQELLGEVEPAAANDVGVDIPANPLRSRDAASKTLGPDGMHIPPPTVTWPRGRDSRKMVVDRLRLRVNRRGKLPRKRGCPIMANCTRMLPADCCQGDRRAGNQGPRDP